MRRFHIWTPFTFFAWPFLAKYWPFLVIFENNTLDNIKLQIVTAFCLLTSHHLIAFISLNPFHQVLRTHFMTKKLQSAIYVIHCDITGSRVQYLSTLCIKFFCWNVVEVLSDQVHSDGNQWTKTRTPCSSVTISSSWSSKSPWGSAPPVVLRSIKLRHNTGIECKQFITLLQ